MPETMVETYLWIDGKFVRIADFEGVLPDSNYIEGAIHCRINGKDVLETKHCDLIDQLWAYITQGLGQLHVGNNYDVFFPDKPIRLRFTIVSPNVVDVTVGETTCRVEYDAFCSTLRRGALAFFAEMARLFPEADSTWGRLRSELEATAG